jgi:hypothetical protein
MLTYGDQRYHVTLGTKRTTVSLDNTLSVLLSLRLGQPPHTPQAQRAVRHWLQARLDEHKDYNRCRTSQWLRNEVVYALITDDLAELYGRWLDQSLDKYVSTSPVVSIPTSHAPSSTAAGPNSALAMGQKTR